jgi:hypothetical protein
MAQKYDRYLNTARPKESLTLKAGDPLPLGAVASEWEKRATVDESKLTELEKAHLAEKGHAYSEMTLEVRIAEGVKLPTRSPQKK